MANYTVTAASVLASASGNQVRNAVAGETVDAGEAVYIDASDSNSIKLAQATSAKYKCVGIATSGAADGQPISYCNIDENFVPGCTLAVSDLVVVSATAGKLAPHADLTTGDYCHVVGVAKSTSVLDLNCSAALRSDAAQL